MLVGKWSSSLLEAEVGHSTTAVIIT